MLKNLVFLFLSGAFLSGAAAQSGTQPKPEEYAVNVNSSGVILDGYDPISIREGNPQKGSDKLSSRYHGAYYHFVSAANKGRFDASPAEYEPAFGGFCAYGVSQGNLVGIEISTYDHSFQNLNIYNYDSGISRKWKKDPAGLYQKALANWPKLAAERIKKGKKSGWGW